MRTRTWPGPGSGVGTSRTCKTSAGSPNCSKTIAFIGEFPRGCGPAPSIRARGLGPGPRASYLIHSGGEIHRSAVPLHARGSITPMSDQRDPLITTDWLEAHLGDPGLRVVDIRGYVITRPAA